jgi:hypothetical protein
LTAHHFITRAPGSSRKSRPRPHRRA